MGTIDELEAQNTALMALIAQRDAAKAAMHVQSNNIIRLKARIRYAVQKQQTWPSPEQIEAEVGPEIDAATVERERLKELIRAQTRRINSQRQSLKRRREAFLSGLETPPTIDWRFE